MIYREIGSAIHGMIQAPGTFRPGDTGETTMEFVDRVGVAIECLPPVRRIVVVTHGGPVAAARQIVEGVPIARLASVIIPPGGVYRFTRIGIAKHRTTLGG